MAYFLYIGGSQQLPEQQGNARRGSPRRPQHRATPQMVFAYAH